MMATVTLAPGSQLWIAGDPLDLVHGGRLDAWQLAYEITGPERAPLVVVQGGISAGRRVAEWWADFAGAAKAIDTERFRVLGIDWLGGSDGSTGPRDVAPFPAVTSHDQARATRLLLDALGIDRVHAWVGASYGGMVGLAFAALFPESLGRLVAIGAAHESHPFSTAQRALQRRVVRLGLENGCGREALAVARGMGMLTYRSPEEFAQRFGSEPEFAGGHWRFPPEAYLEARGQHFVQRFDPEPLLVLSLAIDLHRVDPASVTVPVTLVAATSDAVVPLAQAEELAARLPDCELVVIDSLFGHDAFLKEVAALTPVIERGLAEAG